MISWLLHSALIFFAILYISSSVDPPCCCPKFAISINCSEVTDTVKLVNNGFRCLAKAKNNVNINCNISEIEDNPAIKNIEYAFWKAKEVAQATPISEWSNNKYKLNNTECGRSDTSNKTCSLTSVKWDKVADALTDHDSMVYQCQANITLIDDSWVNIYSNTMWIDVQQNIEDIVTKVQEEGTTGGTLSVRNLYPETKIACAIPDTNPPSKADWYKYDGSTWQNIDLDQSPRKFVVEKVIHSSSTKASLSFVEGSLVIMFFESGDGGAYKCNVTYNDGFGTSTTFERVNNYTLLANDVSTADLGTAKLVSQITKHTYIASTENSSFTCHGRDINANAATSSPYRYSWSYMRGSEYVPLNETFKTWSGITFESYNRTFSFEANHNMTGVEFYCTVSKTIDSTAETDISTKFVPPAILPPQYNIPTTSSQCLDNNTQLLSMTPNTQYFAEPDKDYNSAVSTQNLSGSSFVWVEGSNQVSTFEDQYLEAKGSLMQMNFSKESTNNNKCRYFQLIRSYSKIYQVQEVFVVTRPNAPVGDSSAKCGSINESDFTLDCSTNGGAISVNIPANLGCVRATLKTNSGSVITEKIYHCSSTEVNDTLCIHKTNCLNDQIYTVEYVSDGSSVTTTSSFNPSVICPSPSPTPTQSPAPNPAPNRGNRQTLLSYHLTWLLYIQFVY